MRTRILTTAVAGFCLGTVTPGWGQRSTGNPPITAALIALGDSIFHGKAAGGMCFACHGMNAKGVPSVGPDLTSGKWLQGDGSYASLITIIEAGVPRPKAAPGPMPPLGGSKLGPAEVRAVAAYVFSLSRAKTRAAP
jgi:mono/diheme cytochrome c family protein